MDYHTGKKNLNVCGPQISRLRNQLGWSQPRMAAKCQLKGWDVSRDIIARIELRIRCLTDTEIAILAQVLHVPIEELYPKKIRARLPKEGVEKPSLRK